MKTEALYQLLEHPKIVGDEALESLSNLTEEYPWFGAVHILKARGLQLQGDHQYAEALHLAALYAGNRKVLYDLFVAHDAPETILESAENVEAKTENNADSRRIEKQAGKNQEEDTAPQRDDNTNEAEEIEKTESPVVDSMEKEILVGAVSSVIEIEVLEDSREQVEDGIELDDYSDFVSYLLKRSLETGFSNNLSIQTVSPIPVESDQKISDKKQKEKKDPSELIDAFIKKDPKIRTGQADQYSNEDLARKSLEEDESLITETMAQIYADQGKIEKAKKAYKLLALKYPEKSIYFANRLKKLGKSK